MEKKIFAKRQIIIAMALYYGGIVLVVAGLLIMLQQELYPSALRVIYALPGFAVLIYSSIIVTKNCKCPGCGNSNWPKRSRGKYQALLSFKSIRDGKIMCPQCDEVIGIE